MTTHGPVNPTTRRRAAATPFARVRDRRRHLKRVSGLINPILGGRRRLDRAPPLAISFAAGAGNSISGGRNLRLIWPWQDRNRRFSWLKASAFALVLLPAI